MGYKDRTLRLEFPELGDDIYVVIKNPALLPLRDEPAEWADMAPLERGKLRIARFILSWNVYDAEADGDVPLAAPSVDPGVLDRCPGSILARISQEVERRGNPLAT